MREHQEPRRKKSNKNSTYKREYYIFPSKCFGTKIKFNTFLDNKNPATTGHTNWLNIVLKLLKNSNPQNILNFEISKANASS